MVSHKTSLSLLDASWRERLLRPHFGRRVHAHLARLAAREHPPLIRLNRRLRHRPVVRFFGRVSRLGDGLAWYALMAALLAVDGAAALPAVAHMMLAGLAGTLLYKWLKGATERPRPYQAEPAILCLTAPLDRFSFPSGHTLHAVIFSLVVSAYYPVLAWVVFPFTALVAASRLVLGLHYPSDVVAGALLGALVAWLSFGF